MRLPQAPREYNEVDQNRVRTDIGQADDLNHKKNADLILGDVLENGTLRPQRIEIRGSDDQLYYSLTVVAGALVVTAL
jgi:hypothetical protein